MGYEFQVTSYKLQVTSYRLQVACCLLLVTNTFKKCLIKI